MMQKKDYDEVDLLDSESDLEIGVPALPAALSPKQLMEQLSPEQKAKIEVIKGRIVEIETSMNTLNAEREQCLEKLALISNIIVANRVRNKGQFVARLSLDKKSTSIVDVIAEMCRGTQLLKFGSRGRPHHHQFEITPDHQYIRWYSKKKKKEKWLTAIKLENIMHLQMGHLYKDDLADARYHEKGFSISYRDIMKNQYRTLEVVARSKTDFQIWTKGLELILKRIKDAKKKDGAYVVADHFPKESFMEIYKRDPASIEKRLSKKTDPKRESVERVFGILQKKYEAAAKWRDMAVRNRNSENYSEMDTIKLTNERLTEISRELLELGTDLREGNKKLSVIQGLIHPLIAEVQCLEEKLFVIQ